MKKAFFALLVVGWALGTSVPAQQSKLQSHILVYDLRDTSSREIFGAEGVWEAPNWSPDGSYLILNSGGAIYRLELKMGAKPERLAIPPEYQCNNDKAVSPDGRKLGFSATKKPGSGSQVYVANADGSNIQQRTNAAPSYFHGWSPDGKTMAFVAQRNGSKQFDVYRVATAGGTEQQLNDDPHHDDGPDYSPDGRWIYINSDRSGHEAIWRFPADGAGANDAKAEMVLFDGLEDWFPHASPDGKKLIYIGYPAGTPTHGPRDLPVAIKMATIESDKVSSSRKLLVGFTGGQGSLNVNSWAPDSMRFAYVRYEMVP